MGIIYGNIYSMSSISDIAKLKTLGNLPVPFSILREQYGGYASPAKKIAQLCSQGLLVRVRRGLYVVSDQITGARPSGYLLANHLYGPSYVSLETALEFHGLIPEAVYSYESVTLGHPKEYETPYGTFRYHHVPGEYYSVGIRMAEAGRGQCFLIASPEKALCDHIVATKRLQIRSKSSMRSYLRDFLRIDEDELFKLDSALIHQCSLAGPKRESLLFLKEVVEWIQ
jgi:hypothetical protein